MSQTRPLIAKLPFFLVLIILKETTNHITHILSRLSKTLIVLTFLCTAQGLGQIAVWLFKTESVLVLGL